MTSDVNYFIKVKDHVNKSERLINKVTNLNTYTQDFNTIINYLNKDNVYSVFTSNGEAECTKTETVTIPGYIYNSTKNVNTVVYTLSLVKIDSVLSELFLSESANRETQTNSVKDIQTKETQSSQETDSKVSQTNETQTETADDEFGEFQGCTTEFVDVDLNTVPSYPYYNNVIVPSYNCDLYSNSNSNSYSNSYSNYSYNPFTNIMNLRGENDDVHFNFGSQVPRVPTQVNPIWSPELISELKFRLTQPNSGLLPTNNSSYFL
jgi:hypothetical protein